jgi:hypothetical protein
VKIGEKKPSAYRLGAGIILDSLPKRVNITIPHGALKKAVEQRLGFPL